MSERSARPGEDPRVPLEQPIALRFRYLSEFVDELAANISTGGMFIRSGKPHPVGSIFEFELQLAGEAAPRVTGKAQVAWVRRRAGDDGRPTGMGVRFVEVDDHNRRAIHKLVAGHLESGGTEFALAGEADSGTAAPLPSLEPTTTAEPDRPAPPSPPAAAESPATTAPPPPPAPPRSPRARAGGPPPAAGAAVARSLQRRPGRLWMGVSAALAVALAAAVWWQPGERPPAPGPQAAAAVGKIPPPAAKTAPPPPPTAGSGESGAAATDPVAALPVSAPAEPAHVAAVHAWAEAWSGQRVADYLAAYSSSFEPGGGLGRAGWERQRRARLTAPRWIEVGLAFLESEEMGAGRRRVRFVQSYESDTYSDVVRKELELRREPAGWLIVSERVEP